MKARLKQCPLDQSPLYKLNNRRKLAAIFNLKLHDFESLISRVENYRIFQIEKTAGRTRTVETPKPHLKRLHRRLFGLLARISPPDYLYSGVKGRSYVTNATSHLGARELFKFDIVKFYPSTKRWHVFEFFHDKMKCSRDVSGALAALCTVDDHVPTGSCVSQLVAFYSHSNLFDELNRIASDAGMTMTCYVDDIAVSGEIASSCALNAMRQLIHNRGLRTNKKKERRYRGNSSKEVTGVVIVGSDAKLPNRHHKKIHEFFVSASETAGVNERELLISSAVDRLRAASQIDPKYKGCAQWLTTNNNSFQRQRDGASKNMDKAFVKEVGSPFS